MRNDSNWMLIIIILLIISLFTGGASAILLEGIIYEILYAIHKISSVLFVIFFIVVIRKQSKK
ncbi:MAG: hypothetical protein ACFFCV_04360 [Promethearchaeota archaeon]